MTFLTYKSMAWTQGCYYSQAHNKSFISISFNNNHHSTVEKTAFLLSPSIIQILSMWTNPVVN